MSLALRPYQLDAIERVRASIRRGIRRVLIVAPTGAGKTVVAVYMIARAVENGRRVLFVAHRRELIQQCYRKLLEAGLPESQVGVFMAGDPRRRPGAPVQVASIDTLRNRARPLADIVIVDECHRALAASYRMLQEHYPTALHLGLTATPYRADGRGLDEAYDDMVVVATPRELIAQGFLVEPVVFSVPDDQMPDLSAVKVARGDYDEKALALAVDRQPLVGNIVEHWQKRAGGVRTVAFAVSIEHSKHIAERFNAVGVRAEHLDGMMEKDERDAILARLERGETRLVSSVGVLSEGWDQPSVKCCILARPTKSTGLYLQQAGRILRPWIDPITGSAPRAIILDHAGCALEHGLPQDDRELSLHVEKAKRGKRQQKEPAARRCESCLAVLPLGARACAECGLELPVRESVPEEVEAELVEVKSTPTQDKRAVWDELCAEARAKGFKAGWIFRAFKERFGCQPPRTFFPKLDTRTYTPEEKADYLAQLQKIATARGFKPGWIAIKYKWRFDEPPPKERALATPAMAQSAPTPTAAPEAHDASAPIPNAEPEARDALLPPQAAEGLVEWTV